MRLAAFDERILQRVKTDAHLGDHALESVRSCVRAGLTLEQSLVGLGVIDIADYRHALAAAAGLSFPSSEARYDARFDDLDAFLVDESHQHVSLAFLRPELPILREARRRASEQEQVLRPFVVDRMSVRQARRPESSIDLDQVVTALIDAADRVRSANIRLVMDDNRLHAFSDSGYPFAINLAPAVFSALRLRFKHRSPDGWKFDAPHATATHVFRSNGAVHPAGWSKAIQSFVESPSGMMVLLSSDPFLLRQVAAGTVPLESCEDWKDAMASDRVACCPADSAIGRELAVQAALTGRPVVAVGEAEDGWWSPASEAGIPVHVVRSSATSKGRAWSAHRIRV